MTLNNFYENKSKCLFFMYSCKYCKCYHKLRQTSAPYIKDNSKTGTIPSRDVTSGKRTSASRSTVRIAGSLSAAHTFPERSC